MTTEISGTADKRIIETTSQNQSAENLDRRLPEPRTSAESSVRVMTSEQILGGRGELLIVHGEGVYRLRRTRQNKLILTK